MFMRVLYSPPEIPLFFSPMIPAFSKHRSQTADGGGSHCKRVFPNIFRNGCVKKKRIFTNQSIELVGFCPRKTVAQQGWLIKLLKP